MEKLSLCTQGLGPNYLGSSPEDDFVNDSTEKWASTSSPVQDVNVLTGPPRTARGDELPWGRDHTSDHPWDTDA